MEEGRVQNLKLEEQLSDFTKMFNDLDEEDGRKAQLAINLLLFRRGVVDGSYEQDANLYNFLNANFNLIDSYLNIMGLSLRSDDAFRIAWVDVKSAEEGSYYSPFTRRPMSGNQLILLGVLQKRFATKDSSQNIGIEDSSAVLLTEKDIISDMFLYMKNSDDEGKKKDDAISCINMFCNELGLLRLIWRNRELSDGTVSKVYKVSPFIGYQFNTTDMDALIASVKNASVDDMNTEEEMNDEESV